MAALIIKIFLAYLLGSVSGSLLLGKFGNAEYAQWSAWRMGWIHYLSGHYQKAQDQFKENARHYPAGDFIEYNLFWQAKSLEKLRDLGNSVLVVEHDKDMMIASDYVSAV